MNSVYAERSIPSGAQTKIACAAVRTIQKRLATVVTIALLLETSEKCATHAQQASSAMEAILWK